MPTEWRVLSRSAGLAVREGGIEARFLDGRSQRVYVEEGDPEVIRVWSVAASPSALRQLDDANLALWHRNRLSDLVGFKTDGRGRAIGEAWVAREGLDAEEWATYVRAVAFACDRLEYLLTGRDEE